MIILSAVGTGNYREVTYRFERREEPVRTEFFAEALARWHPDAHVMILITPNALEKHGAVLKERLPHHEPVQIPNGQNEEEYWDMFSALVERIPANAEIIFDITNGFRSLPMLGFLMLAYLRVVRGVKIRHVLYGALEASKDGETPVFDLTPFVQMLDWASASERFIDTGDARRMVGLLSDHGDLRSVSAPIEALSNALIFQRPAEASHAAQHLRKEIKKIKRVPLKREQQQFALALEHIEERFDGIAHSDDAYRQAPERALRGQYRQILFYMRGGQFAQAIELTREWLLSVRLWKAGSREIFDSESRTQAKIDRLPSLSKSPDWNTFHTLYRQVFELRNSFAHFHTNVSGETMTSEIDIRSVQELIALLPTAVRPLGLDLNEGQL